MLGDITVTTECPIEDIAAYIDGELDARQEMDLEVHFAGCGSCLFELNRQKQFLCGLNMGLARETELELPPDFTRLVVANAESTVSGLRKPRERFNALFICAGLILFVLFAIGPEARRVLDGFSTVIEQVAIVGGFFGHLIYAFFIGVAIVLRSIATQLLVDRWTEGMLVGVLFVMCLMLTRKLLLRMRRV